MTRSEKLHVEAEELREQGRFAEALVKINDALAGYQAQHDQAKVSEVLQSRFLIYKHLFLWSGDIAYAFLARSDARSSFDIAQELALSEVLPSVYFRLGEAEMLLAHFKEAVANYQKAVESYPGESAEKGDWRYHWGEALYRSGYKAEGKKKILEGLAEIQKNADHREAFLIHVWESGAFLRLADLLREDDPDLAKDYFQKAKKIIDADDRLILRKKQLDQLIL